MMMETLQEAIARLERRGFVAAFLAQKGGTLAVRGRGEFDPEALVVEELVRFEGATDPGDESVLFALRTRGGEVRGTFVTTYGTYAQPESVAAMRRLDARPEARQSAERTSVSA